MHVHERSKIFNLKKLLHFKSKETVPLFKVTLLCYPSVLTGHFRRPASPPWLGDKSKCRADQGAWLHHQAPGQKQVQREQPKLRCPTAKSLDIWPTGERLAKPQQPQRVHSPWICRNQTANVLLGLTSGEGICPCKRVAKADGMKSRLLWKSSDKPTLQLMRFSEDRTATQWAGERGE